MEIVIKNKGTDEEKISAYYKIIRILLQKKSKNNLVDFILRRMAIGELVEYVASNTKHTIEHDKIIYSLD